ncbi:hypothetical protein [Microvirga calopogonii]|uniref:hypothetical protein n=1 Tax=Microvirga calopogonii TaxID=2078013 RepID=UPI000E0D7D1F|nr:hypothetical protein [Microvirga calopogonii]
MFLTTASAFADEITCRGPFAKDTDHKRLVASFGRENVIRTTVREPEGLAVRASIVFPKDPVRRLVVLWSDEKTLRRPVRIRLEGSGWSGPEGLRIGSPIEAVEKANGKPFTLYGFEWDYGGSIENWNGGALGTLPGGCTFSPVFETDDEAPSEALDAVSGDSRFASDTPAMRAAKPRIGSLALGYSQR